MPSHGIRGDTHWLKDATWQVPDLEISRTKSWPLITALSYCRGDGETIWQSDRYHRLILAPDPCPPWLMQIGAGPSVQMPAAPAGSLAFCPPRLTLRTVQPAARYIHVIWDADLYASLLPELRGASLCFEFLSPLHNPLLRDIVVTLAHEIENDGFADRILVESLGTALCVGVARCFVGRLSLPTSKGLSPDRLRRVRDYIEAHLNDELSLGVLANVACLSPYHFSRSFKEATGLGPQRYVRQTRLERAKRLLYQTDQPLRQIALEAGFADQSHLTFVFRRELGTTPGRFRAAMA
jgi:AraC family transcriptional regulator